MENNSRRMISGEAKDAMYGMVTPEESLGITSEEYNRIVDACIWESGKEEDDTHKIEDYLERIAINRVAELLKGDTFYYQDVECCVISDAEECYIQGYKDAVQEACEWLKKHLPPAMVRSDLYMFNGEFINDLKKAMEE